jgi:MPBQ/MSBQ methyltransferase
VSKPGDSGLAGPVHGESHQTTAPSQIERLIAYYEEAGPDYEEWSPAFNMHFGYCRRGLNPLRRERMLEELNRQVLNRLCLIPDRDDLIVDLGCGVGATIRSASRRYPQKRILGITIVPWQVEKGNAWNRKIGLGDRARLELADYTCSGLPTASVDGAYAIESSCHAAGPAKEPFVREAARILKPGARLVVADGFLKHPERRLGPISRYLSDEICRSFVVPEFGKIEEFRAILFRNGFSEVAVEDISWRVAPSALQAPFVVLGYALKKLVRREPLGEQSINNLRGSLLSAALGADRRKFGYYLISAKRG